MIAEDEYSIAKFIDECNENGFSNIVKFTIEIKEKENFGKWLNENVGAKNFNGAILGEAQTFFIGFIKEDDASLAMLTWTGITKFKRQETLCRILDAIVVYKNNGTVPDGWTITDDEDTDGLLCHNVEFDDISVFVNFDSDNGGDLCVDLLAEELEDQIADD